MNKINFVTEYSLWFVLLCLIVAGLYSFILYQKKSPWNKKINYSMAAIRFVVVFIISFLLLGPLLKYLKNYTEKPSIVFAIDNSQSIELATDSTILNNINQQLHLLANKMENEGIEVEVQTFDDIFNKETLKRPDYKQQSTNISGLLNNIRSNFENRNLNGVILITDGIYNEGISPLYNNYPFPVHTIGLGDTTAKKDINLKNIYFNKLAYAGNQFPIVAEIQNTGFSGSSAKVNLINGGKVISQQVIKFTKEQDLQEIKFLVASDKKGLQHYQVQVESLPNEFTYQNNSAHAYIDIIEGKEKILIAALTPHPDIKALKNALETKETFQVDVHIPGMNELKNEKYDLIIFHQIPDNQMTGKSVFSKLKEKTPAIYIVGNQTNIGYLNNENSLINIMVRSWSKDNASPSFNSNFEKFKLGPEDVTIINKYPPLITPYADFQAKGNTEIILNQRIGSLATEKPLLIINKDNSDRKSAILLGEGIWQWRLQEAAEHKNSATFDKLFTNLVQLISSKDDKRKFRFYPVNNEFMASDKIMFEAEIYNSLYEKTYNKTIQLKLTNENGESTNYSFVNSEASSRFEIKGLKEGVYKYTATTKIDDKNESSSGEFLIKDISLEALEIKADHELLRNISNQSGGQFIQVQDIDNLYDQVLKNKTRSIIHTSEEFKELINMEWFLFLILALISLEWFFRKFKGSY